MGRPNSELPLVLTWIISTCKNRTIEKRKWYDAKIMFEIYKNSKQHNDKNDSSAEKNETYKIRSFSQHMITIIDRNSFPQLKTRYKRGSGRQFIVVYENEMNTDISNIQMSTRSRFLCNNMNTLQDTTPTTSQPQLQDTNPLQIQDTTPSQLQDTTPTMS